MPNIAVETPDAGARARSVPVHVMVAVIFNHRDEVLVALRNRHSHQGGLWEFPGGKPEPDEPRLQALHREIHEETGLRLLASHPLCRVEHRYADKHVLLDVHLVSRHAGEPSGKEGQRIEWRARQELLAADFPAANARIVELLRLPETITITPDVDSESEFLELMRKLIASGRELVQVRQTKLPPDRYRKRFMKAMELAAGSRTRLLFNNLPECFEFESPDCGFHASSRVLAELDRRPVLPGCLFSASCHSLAELRRAETLGADFVLLSPVAATGKYQASQLLGWNGFRRLADQVSLPVYALGGMRPELARPARAHGAFGVAGISGFVR
ncbi:MAG: Nudix family hydrolase [Gammaproteobacteria bacterium]|nr:Nudix family hydrolase [Gammaproteobacteria bacterium]